MLSLSNVSILKNTTAVAPTAIAQWAKSIDGAGSEDQVRGVAVDTLGNAYVVGHYNIGAITVGGVTLPTPAGGNAAYIIKFNTSGTAQWGKKIDGTGSDYGQGVAVDASGNAYVTGYYGSAAITVDGVTLPIPAGGEAAYIIKFNTSGTAQWGKKIDGTNNDRGQGVAVDTSGNVYVTGYYQTAAITVDGVTLDAPTGQAAFIIKFDKYGTAQWGKQIDGTGTDIGNGVAVDTAGNVYVTGFYQNSAITVDGVATLPVPAGSNAGYIIKFDKYGTAQWGKKIDGTDNDQGKGVAVDTAGNVYVTGYYLSGAITVDGVTLDAPSSWAAYIIKFNTSGTAQWGKKIDGTGNYDDGRGVTVDTLGNVYVTGYYNAAITLDNGVHLLTPTGIAAFLIKYTTTGVAQWAKSIDSTGTNNALGVAVDTFGNVYVGGQYNGAITLDNGVSLPAPTSMGGFVIKYTSQDATLTPYKLISDTASTSSKLLVNTSPYTATVNVRNTADTATLNTLTVGSGAYTAVTWSNAQFATDTLACPSLNVSGGKTIIDSLGGITGYNSNATWATSGDITCRSITTMNPTSALQVDESDATMLSLSNVSVLKNSLAVPAAATALWAKAINAATGAAVATDASGNVYVTGIYTSTSEIVLQASPSVSLPTVSGNAVYTVKYNSTGVPQWASTIDGSGSDFGNGIATDAAGNVYVTGSYISTMAITLAPGVILPISVASTASDTFLVKYSASGVAQWVTTITSIYDDRGRGIATDATGNVYITGAYYGSTTLAPGVTLPGTLGGHDGFIVKYNTSGVAQWAETIMGSTASDMGLGIATDATGNVYVSGYYSSTTAITINARGVILPITHGIDAFVIKYNSSGVAQWATTIKGISTGMDSGAGVATDATENVYVTGYYNSSTAITINAATGVILPITHGVDAFVIKYNSSGVAQWATTIQGTGSDEGGGIATDATGNVYVSGYYISTTPIILAANAALPSYSSQTAFIVKYDTRGIAQWATTINGTSASRGNGISVDAMGNVCVVGFYTSTTAISLTPTVELPITTGQIAFIVKYSSTDAVTTPYTLVSNPASTDYKLLVNSSPYPATVNVRNTADTATLNTLTVGSGAYTAVTWSNAQFATDTLACPSLNVSGGKTIIDSLGGITGYNSNATWATSGDITCRSITTANPTSALQVDESDATMLSLSNVSILKNTTAVAPTAIAQWARSIDGAGTDEHVKGVAVDTAGNVYVTGQYNTGAITVDGVTLPTPLGGIAAYIIKFNASGTAQWGKKIDGAGNDYGQGVAVDTAGNVYVTGVYMYNASITVDGVTLPAPVNSNAAAYIIKFNTSGVAQWGKKIDGTGSDYGHGVAVDTSGNVYVTGYYNTAAITVDGVTLPIPLGSNAGYIIKFNTSGIAQWGHKIDGTGEDSGQGVAVDTSGNVYVTGLYNGAITVDGVILAASVGGTVAAFIIKFNTSGTAQWGKKIDGMGSDHGYGVAVDTSGNVYVTGHYGAAITLDNGVSLLAPTTGSVGAFLIKYTTTGVAQWAKSIDSTVNDQGFGVAADAFGNVYIGGVYNGALTLGNGVSLPSPSTSSGGFIIKYTSQDATLTPYKLISNTASTSSKLLVNTSPYTATVNVRNTADTATLNTLTVGSGAYTAVTWSNAQFATDTLACPSLNVSGGKTIIDSLGGITGYNSNATWATSGDITCRSITTANNSTVLTVDESDALTLSTVANISILKNSNPGVANALASWGKKIDGLGGDVGKGVAVDAAGNVYVTGYYNAVMTVDGVILPRPAGGTVAAFIIKFNTSGTAQWGKTIDATGEDVGNAVAVDTSGNVYVTGYYNTGAVTVDAVTLAAPVGQAATYIIKFNTSGIAQWGKTIDGTGTDAGRGVAVDTAGNVYMTGYYSTSAITVDGVTLPTPAGQAAYIIKFNTSGIAQWGKTIDGTGTEIGCGVAVDTSGNVYVTGYYAGAVTVDGVTLPTSDGTAAYIMKFNTSGTAQWGKKIDGTGTDVGYGVAVDTSGNVYVTGNYTAAAITVDEVTLAAPVEGNAAYIIKFNTSGTAQWGKKIDGTGNDYGEGVAVDTSGNVYVTGYYQTGAITVDWITLAAPAGTHAAYIIKFNTSGTAQWGKKIDGTGNDYGQGVAVDTSGNVYVTGYYFGNAITVDGVTLPVPDAAGFAAFIIKYRQGDWSAYQLVSNTSTTTGFYKLLVNSSASPAVVEVRNAGNTATRNIIEVPSKAVKALTWYGTEFFAI
jgi:hypothetical protein